jgi:hypothetical protein
VGGGWHEAGGGWWADAGGWEGYRRVHGDRRPALLSAAAELAPCLSCALEAQYYEAGPGPCPTLSSSFSTLMRPSDTLPCERPRAAGGAGRRLCCCAAAVGRGAVQRLAARGVATTLPCLMERALCMLLPGDAATCRDDLEGQKCR